MPASLFSSLNVFCWLPTSVLYVVWHARLYWYPMLQWCSMCRNHAVCSQRYIASASAEEEFVCVTARLTAAYSLQPTHWIAGLKPADLENPNPASALQFLVNPSAQIQELQQALTALSGQTANSQVGIPLPHVCKYVHLMLPLCIWCLLLVIRLSMRSLQSS